MLFVAPLVCKKGARQKLHYFPKWSPIDQMIEDALVYHWYNVLQPKCKSDVFRVVKMSRQPAHFTSYFKYCAGYSEC